jgi:acyl-homoserine-lactone acylase
LRAGVGLSRGHCDGHESGDPASPHFNDQAVRYSQGDLRDVYFYPEQLNGHTERKHRPGE